MFNLVLLRHGNSLWNQKNLFTGWVDVDLSDQGREEAKRAGELLGSAGLMPDVLFTSVLKRAINTAHIALDQIDRNWIDTKRSWRLNERHYGALQGLDKAETLEKFGPEQFQIWRRSYDTPPPEIADDA
ncbi:MAG: 2,3-bisphosphoglycerate-dependent phosphoglycerate mutase, partial [Actinobacteria bacterium]|nr:2,3-bisphosphoglycerate-dependent phosphoglycerate mutase [Actinomycetota bacterium]NCW95530.1 2,3-bisphosphoglycerate-dependent phosphoglycerate mutase [Actinomycetota bacterium]